MDSHNVNAPEERPQGATQTGLDGVEAVQGYARGATQAAHDARHSIRSHAEDAKRTVVGPAQGFANEAERTASAAADTGRAYARQAINAAGRKIGGVSARADQIRKKGAAYVMDQPVRSVFMSAVGAAAITALLIAAMRGGRRG